MCCMLASLFCLLDLALTLHDCFDFRALGVQIVFCAMRVCGCVLSVGLVPCPQSL